VDKVHKTLRANQFRDRRRAISTAPLFGPNCSVVNLRYHFVEFVAAISIASLSLVADDFAHFVGV